MGKNNKIGAYITLDGAKTFQASVTSCNKDLKALQSELKLVEAFRNMPFFYVQTR